MLGKDLLGDPSDHALDRFEHVLLRDEAHLDVDLGVLRLPVAAQVLVAEGARQLVVAVVAGDHQQLLEHLRALRQCVELAGAQPRRDHEVAGALRRGADEVGGLDLDEAVVLQRAANRTGQPRAHQHPRLHRRPAQVQVAVLQAQRLVQAGLLLVDVERRHLAGVEDGEPIHRHLDRPGRQLRVGGALRPLPHHALDLHHPFAARRLGRGVGLGRVLLVGDHLGQAVAVAQVEEGEMPVVAPPMDPARQRHALPDMLGTQLAAGVASECLCHGTLNGSESAGPAQPSLTIRGTSSSDTSRCSPESRSRSTTLPCSSSSPTITAQCAPTLAAASS